MHLPPKQHSFVNRTLRSFRKPRLGWLAACGLVAGMTGFALLILHDGVGGPRVSGSAGALGRSSSLPATSRLLHAATGLRRVQLCQSLGPAAPYCIKGIDGAATDGCGEQDWGAMGNVPYQMYAQGEYVGRARIAHVPEYRLRVDDQLEFLYRLTREETATPYRLNVGDEVQIESFTDPELNSNRIIQPDGTITVRLLGQVKATGRTLPELREALYNGFLKYYKNPDITVAPLRVNTKLEDLRQAVDSRYSQGGQTRIVRVNPEGTIGLPVVGTFSVQGLTLEELEREVNERYNAEIFGIEVIPVLYQRAPRYVFVVGEVKTPGRYTLEGPTTVTQAIAMSGSWNVGANLRQIVVFRRGDDWRLMATMLDVQGALYAKRPTPSDEIWLGDSDVVVVPKGPLLVADDFINLVFTRGIYAVFPFSTSLSYTNLTSFGSGL
jgi:polysaccharide export outer membrane protein